MTFIQELNAMRLVNDDNSISVHGSLFGLEPGNSTTISRRPLLTDSKTKSSQLFSLLTLNSDELNMESYEAVLAFTLKHRPLEFYQELEKYIKNHKIEMAKNIFGGLLHQAPNFNGMDDYLALPSKEEKLALIRELWKGSIEKAFKAEDFFSSEKAREITKTSPEFLVTARANLAKRMDELVPEQNIVCSMHGTMFIASTQPNVLLPAAVAGVNDAVCLAPYGLIVIPFSALTDSHTIREEVDHFSGVKAEVKPNITLSMKLKDGRDPRVLNILKKTRDSRGYGSNNYYSSAALAKLPAENLGQEILFDIIELARNHAKNIGTTVNDQKVDAYMKSNFRDYWADRIKADRQIADYAMQLLTELLGPDEAAKISEKFNVKPGTKTGHSY